MDIKKLLDQVRSQLGDEAVTTVSSILKTIESGVVELQDDIKRVSGEAKSRRLSIQDLESKIADKDTEIESWKKKADTSEVTKEVETLREFKSNTLKGQRDSFASKFQTISKHPNFDKVKGFYKLPDPDKDGKYDLSKMEDKDLEFNISKLNEHETAELFGKVEKPSVHGSPRTDQPGGNVKQPDVKSEADLQNQFLSGFEQFGH